MELEIFESHEGGRYRFDSGNKYQLRAFLHEVAAPERITGTFEYED